jgi:hypothetical protein
MIIENKTKKNYGSTSNDWLNVPTSSSIIIINTTKGQFIVNDHENNTQGSKKRHCITYKATRGKENKLKKKGNEIGYFLQSSTEEFCHS